MRNENSPLIQALKGRVKPKESTSFDKFEPPRTFQIKHGEVPGLPGRPVGEHVSVRIHGKIHSQSADGHAIVHVDRVDAKPDSSDRTKEDYPDLKANSKSGALRVQTEESHA